MILAEEFGEAAREANERYFRPETTNLEALRNELIQTAAVAVRIIEAIDRGDYV
jgi:hypothetical protein